MFPAVPALGSGHSLSARRHTPVVYLSGYDSPFHAAAAKSAGCDEYIVKPFELRSIDRVFKLYLSAEVGQQSDGEWGGTPRGLGDGRY